ncbi:hypothetical protein DIPPA_08546 [Diplonema papillatum]|nr:hypothetical protein DIPPA_08546 [Diplonema papillatum]
MTAESAPRGEEDAKLAATEAPPPREPDAAGGEGGAEEAEEKVAVEVKKPRGRKNPLVDETAEGADLPVWKVIFGSVIATIIAIDDEWIWIPGTIYAVFYYAYKQARNAAAEVASIPPVSIASGIAAGGVAMGVTPLVVPLLPLGISSELARKMYFAPVSLMSPLTWGLRLGVFTHLVGRAIKDTHVKEDGAYWRLSHLFFYGGCAEVFARVSSAPFCKVADLVAKHPEQTAAKAVKDYVKIKGVLSLWEGMAPLRVEVPHMALLLGSWGFAREKVTSSFCEPWQEDADLATRTQRALHRFPIDFALGGLCTAFANTVTHSWRNYYEEHRIAQKGFTETYGVAACPLVTRHLNINLKTAITLRAPHTALFFGLYGACMNVFAPSYKEVGVSGWGEHDVQRFSDYGGAVFDEKLHDDSFWAFFGARLAQKRYNHSIYKDDEKK